MCFGGGKSADDIFKEKMAKRPKFELPSLAMPQSGSKGRDPRKSMKDVDVKALQRKGQQQRSLINMGNNY